MKSTKAEINPELLIANVERAIQGEGTEDENEAVEVPLAYMAALRLADDRERAIACIAFAWGYRAGRAEEDDPDDDEAAP